MDINICIDNTPYTSKPKDVHKIQYRLHPTKINLENFIELVGAKGCSFRPGFTPKGTKDYNWVSQQIFALDFDKNTTTDTELTRCSSYSITPILGYYSFSHSPETPKFRLVFCFKEPINTIKERNLISHIFKGLFEHSDPKAYNPARLFYGGKGIFQRTTDPNVFIDKDDFIGRLKNTAYMNLEKLRKESPHEFETDIPSLQINNTINSNVIKTLKERDIPEFQNLIKLPPKTFISSNAFWDYVCYEINMPQLLGINKYKSFKCFFHEDNTESASIFKHYTGAWLYKCFSSPDDCSIKSPTLNNKRLIQNLTKISDELGLLEFCLKAFNCKINTPEIIKQNKTTLEELLRFFEQDDDHIDSFKSNCPTTYRNIKKLKHNLIPTLIKVAIENLNKNIFLDENDNLVFYISMFRIYYKMTGEEPKKGDLYRLGQKIACLSYHKILIKKSEEEIPKEFLRKSKEVSRKNNLDKIVNYYSFPLYTPEGYLNNIEKQGIQWKENQYTIKGCSFEMFCRAEGKNVAQKIYPQFVKIKLQKTYVDEDTGETKEKTEIIDRTVTTASTENTKRICNQFHQLIEKQGYAFEKQLIENSPTPNADETQLQKIRGQLEDYGLERVILTQELKRELGLIGSRFRYVILKTKAV